MFNKILIFKNNLINNIKQVKKENPNSKICAMVKANAYGVGDNQVVHILENYVDFFGVTCFFEAQKIKKITKKQILIVGGFEKDEIDATFSYACFDLEQIEQLISTNKEIKVHLKVNSGMNRFGFKSLKNFKKALKSISNSDLILEGIYTHFATMDEFVHKQMQEFIKYVNLCKSMGFNPIVHVDNSFVNEKFNHHLNMVRIGFNLYNRTDGWFLPAIELKSKILQIQDVKKGELVGYSYRCVANQNMRIAIIPMGYADGFNLKLIGFEVDVDGKKCKILNICMDCLMLDVSKTDLKKGDEIFFVNKFNSLNSYANYLETSVYEVMTNFSYARVERVLV